MDDFTRRYYRNPQQPRKVVSIPVLDGSRSSPDVPAALPEWMRLQAAVRIQKVLRGFLVRKNVKAVRDLERQILETERRINGSRDLIARDEKERLKASETVMSLLLKLDSVRGVRDYRRKVVRRAVSLQESLDAETAEESGVEEEKEAVESGGGEEIVEMERLRGTVAKLVESGEEQRELVRRLSRRVEELERTVERLRRRRGKRQRRISADCAQMRALCSEERG